MCKSELFGSVARVNGCSKQREKWRHFVIARDLVQTSFSTQKFVHMYDFVLPQEAMMSYSSSLIATISSTFRPMSFVFLMFGRIFKSFLTVKYEYDK